MNTSLLSSLSNFIALFQGMSLFLYFPYVTALAFSYINLSERQLLLCFLSEIILSPSHLTRKFGFGKYEPRYYFMWQWSVFLLMGSEHLKGYCPSMSSVCLVLVCVFMLADSMHFYIVYYSWKRFFNGFKKQHSA